MGESCVKTSKWHDGVVVSSVKTKDPRRSLIIRKFGFTENGRSVMVGLNGGRDWPVVYLITNTKEIYIGETCDIHSRMKSHLGNSDRQNLKEVHVIFDDYANKSATLDMEQSLIRLCGADGRFTLQNLNAGQSSSHDYYKRKFYVAMMPELWGELKNLGLAKHDYHELSNSAIFKYSPYTALTSEQKTIKNDVLCNISEVLDAGKKGSFIINGSAGTGKTVLAMSIMLSLAHVCQGLIDETQEIVGFMDEQGIKHEINSTVNNRRNNKEHGDFKIGLVVPMTSLRKTLKKVFKRTPGLEESMVLGPCDVARGKYDVLVVDESHRLARYKNLGNNDSFLKACENLKMDPQKATQLDWIVACSDYQVLFYDSHQTVKGSDLTHDQFEESISKNECKEEAVLTTQIRCEGGGAYVDYVSDILFGQPECRKNIENYQFKLFDDVDEMVQLIKQHNSEEDLCRCVAGYSWKWVTKKKKRTEIREKKLYDIDIQGHKYVWNMKGAEWILRKDSIDEIGCIHTTQGYDLNYVGVIFGREVDYDKDSKRIVINPELFFDKNVKTGVSPDMLRTYILNAYQVMLTRGIKGCYVYACNPGMAEYLGEFIDRWNQSD